MASQTLISERIRELVAAVLAAEEDDPRETIEDIEAAMIRIGDQVAREFGVQKLARRTEPTPEHPPCPDCGGPGQFASRPTRELVTSRGKVPVTEAKYRCPKCRRHFFPSDGGIGT